jgi:hypothetical protein
MIGERIGGALLADVGGEVFADAVIEAKSVDDRVQGIDIVFLTRADQG